MSNKYHGQPNAMSTRQRDCSDAYCFVSVIVCTRNRAQPLSRNLKSLARQDLPATEFEIVVVDDGSEDNTAAVCESARRESHNLRYVATGVHVGLARARSLGLKESRGDYLLFTDDDCIAHSDWARHMRDALSREEIVAGAVAASHGNYFKLCHSIAQFHEFMPGRKAGPRTFIAGANMGFRRSVLEALNGFDRTARCAEDTELILRACSRRHRPHFLPEAIVTHDPERTNLRSIFRYAVEHAATTIRLRNRYRRILRTPFLLRSPLLLIIASPVIALKVTADVYLRNPLVARLFWTIPIVYALKVAWCFGAARGLRAAPQESRIT